MYKMAGIYVKVKYGMLLDGKHMVKGNESVKFNRKEQKKVGCVGV